MRDIIDEKNIQLLEKVENWKESIKIGAQPLLENSYITGNYIDSMIKNIEQFGFYVVITEKVALPHSRPENGALKTGLSMLKLDIPVMYGDEEVYIILVLAVKKEKEHIDLLMRISNIFEDEEVVNALLELKSKEEIINFLSKY
jgi:mannitol/fructose-specific phosphotransferase system IIA component (Ntr-type)